MQVKQYLSFTVWPLMMTSLVLGGGRYPPEPVPFAISVEKRKRTHALNTVAWPLQSIAPRREAWRESAFLRAVATLGLGTPLPFWEAPAAPQPSRSLPGLRPPGLFHTGGSGHVTELWPMGFEHI